MKDSDPDGRTEASLVGTVDMQDPLIPVAASDFKSTRQSGGIRPCNGMANSLCRERIAGSHKRVVGSEDMSVRQQNEPCR